MNTNDSGAAANQPAAGIKKWQERIGSAGFELGAASAHIDVARIVARDAEISDLRAALALKQQVVEYEQRHAAELETALAAQPAAAPTDMILHCPKCGQQHVDKPEPHDLFPPFGSDMDREKWSNPPHRLHLCHACGHIWRPADVPTNGVRVIKTAGKSDSPAPAAAPLNTQQPSATEVQWRNIRKVVRELAVFCFGGPDATGSVSLSAAYTALVNSLTAKDGLDVQLEPLPSAAQQPGAAGKFQKFDLTDYSKPVVYSNSAGAAPSGVSEQDERLSTSEAAIEWAQVFYRNADTFTQRDLAIVQAAWAEATSRAALAQQAAAQPELTVWYGPMPESNGKSNFTATLMRKGADPFDTDQYTFSCSEYPDRVRYEADCMRYLIGEVAEKPWITDYDANKHSGYTAPAHAGADDAKDAARYWFLQDCWLTIEHPVYGPVATYVPPSDGDEYAADKLDAVIDAFIDTMTATPSTPYEAMPVSQEPKYGIRDNRLFNRASGEFIPTDEPVFIFRARDELAIKALDHYRELCGESEHSAAVYGRMRDFEKFAVAHRERMKVPDTAAPSSQKGVATQPTAAPRPIPDAECVQARCARPTIGCWDECAMRADAQRGIHPVTVSYAPSSQKGQDQ
jgi:hypothetical protein